MDEGAPPRKRAHPWHASLIWEPDPEEPLRDEEAPQEEDLRGGLVGHLQSVAEPVATAVEPIVSHVASVADALGNVLEAAGTAISGRNPAARRLRRLNRIPLANLYEVYPDARQASPRELGLRFIPAEEIRGTAVAGAAQRGSDFLPLPPFRGENWTARWRRIRDANERLQPLPPVDLIKYKGAYWVLDGHNRVASALYSGGVGLDAMVTELVPLDGQTSERPTLLAGLLNEAGELRAAAAGRRPAFAMRYGEHYRPGEPDALADSVGGAAGDTSDTSDEHKPGEKAAGEPGHAADEAEG